MDIIKQVEKHLQDSFSESKSAYEPPLSPYAIEFEVIYALFASMGFSDAGSSDTFHFVQMAQQKEFVVDSEALPDKESHALLSLRKQLKSTYDDDWVNGFVEAEKFERERERLRRRIFASETHEEVLDVLSESEFEGFVQDYTDYLVQRRDDLFEDESPDVFLQSLQAWAWFLLDYSGLKNLPKAKTSADLDGCLELEWELSGDEIQGDPDNEFYGKGRGLAVLTFYPASLNHLSILSGAYTGGKQRMTLDCFLSHDKTVEIIDLFAERLLNPYE